MKVKIVQGFKDKHTNKRYLPGEIIEVTEERLKEIEEKDKRLVKRVPEMTKEGLEKLKIQELREKAKEIGVDDSGKKEELVERICNVIGMSEKFGITEGEKNEKCED